MTVLTRCAINLHPVYIPSYTIKKKLAHLSTRHRLRCGKKKGQKVYKIEKEDSFQLSLFNQLLCLSLSLGIEQRRRNSKAYKKRRNGIPESRARGEEEYKKRLQLVVAPCFPCSSSRRLIPSSSTFFPIYVPGGSNHCKERLPRLSGSGMKEASCISIRKLFSSLSLSQFIHSKLTLS